jgi:hypothetical protein
MIGALAFDQRNGARQRRTVAAADGAREIGLCRGRRPSALSDASTSLRTRSTAPVILSP